MPSVHGADAGRGRVHSCNSSALNDPIPFSQCLHAVQRKYAGRAREVPDGRDGVGKLKKETGERARSSSLPLKEHLCRGRLSNSSRRLLRLSAESGERRSSDYGGCSSSAREFMIKFRFSISNLVSAIRRLVFGVGKIQTSRSRFN